jgi:hypothetical protein
VTARKVDPLYLIGLLNDLLDPLGDTGPLGEKAFSFFRNLGLLNEEHIDMAAFKAVPPGAPPLRIESSPAAPSIPRRSNNSES